LSSELAPTIRVNCVAPGWVDTNLNDPVFHDEEFVHRVVDAIPLKRVATADDVALSIVFLASDWSRHITGEILKKPRLSRARRAASGARRLCDWRNRARTSSLII
jgi:NAD(P)-dependent dehydrogenase (short-subunit alcohol dehydrogenase family)